MVADHYAEAPGPVDVDHWRELGEAMLGRAWNEVCGCAPQHGYARTGAALRFGSLLTAVHALTHRSVWHKLSGLDTDGARLQVLRKLTDIYGTDRAVQLMKLAASREFNEQPPEWWHNQGPRPRPKRKDLWRGSETR